MSSGRHSIRARGLVGHDVALTRSLFLFSGKKKPSGKMKKGFMRKAEVSSSNLDGPTSLRLYCVNRTLRGILLSH